MDKTKKFKDELVVAVKAVGQELINRAEDIVGDPVLLSRMIITIDFNPEFDMRIPTLKIEKEHIPKLAYDIVIWPDKKEEI